MEQRSEHTDQAQRPASRGAGRHSASRGKHGRKKKRNFPSTVVACCVALSVCLVGFLAISEPVGSLDFESDEAPLALSAASSQSSVGSADSSAAGSDASASSSQGSSGASADETVIEDDDTPLAGPSAVAAGGSVELSDKQMKAISSQLFDLINEDRADSGRNDLKKSSGLVATSKVRVAELPTAWSHTRPDGSDWSTALGSQGFKVGSIYAAENMVMTSVALSSSYSDQDVARIVMELHESLLSHTDQKRNALSRSYSYAGLSVAQVADEQKLTIYLCQHLCSEAE